MAHTQLNPVEELTLYTKKLAATTDAPHTVAEKSAIVSRGLAALEAIITDRAVPLAVRVDFFLQAPEKFKNTRWSPPYRENALLDLYIEHLEYCGALAGTVNVTQDVEWALVEYKQDPQKKMGYKNNIPCATFLEEILTRNLLAFNV